MMVSAWMLNVMARMQVYLLVVVVSGSGGSGGHSVCGPVESELEVRGKSPPAALVATQGSVVGGGGARRRRTTVRDAVREVSFC
jgi:hypothetical protein